MYWDIGRTIVGRQEGKSWGKAVVERLAADLRAEFPGVGGFSASNLWRMKAFYEAYAGSEKLAPLVRELAGFRVPAEKKPAWCFDPSTDRLDLSAWQNFKTGARMSAWI